MANITKEGDILHKKSSKYDEMFYSLLNKINKGLKEEEQAKFDAKSKVLFINGKIKANDENFIALYEQYKFWIQKELI